MDRTALITGVTGQDGYYLSQSLLASGYTVYGLVRRTSAPARVPPEVVPLAGDVTDLGSLIDALKEAHPDEVYNLAAQSHVGESFSAPILTAQVNAIGALNVVQAASVAAPGARLYQAGTSEMFGGLTSDALSENSLFHPRSPYGVAKVFAHHTFVQARERGVFACNGILFNHESPRRGEQFVTKKIVREAVRLYEHGRERGPLMLGDVTAIRDWGHARDYVEAMRLMLNHTEPGDYVVGTGVCRSVWDFVVAVFKTLGMDPSDGGLVRSRTPEELRPTEVHWLRADASKAKRVLGWLPQTSFADLVGEMVDAELVSNRSSR